MPAAHLYHFSESPDIQIFEPHVAATSDNPEPLVWAIDAEHEQLYWYPRQCPRIAFWPGRATPPEARAWYETQTSSPRVHAIEWGWFERVRAAQLFRYVLDAAPFIQNDRNAGHWVAHEPVRPLRVDPLDDLLGRHRASAEELRLVASFWPLWDYVVQSGLAFSGTRLRNATRP